MMQKIDQFLESLVHYDKENIHPNIITALEPYLKDKEFDPDFIRSTSRVVLLTDKMNCSVGFKECFFESFTSVSAHCQVAKEARETLRKLYVYSSLCRLVSGFRFGDSGR